ncbi:rhomboid family intramembrane serine protease [Clostridium sp. SHJSY1]|uniref:rhomboid family intramembrane serine protease n=1 Tax=Clostridium sp. SHJSY1 TaxID=2942483 RepID=UPI002875925F|nr:rhomboid family intramembrane serine protease [Clostridium sp. SHJSY1]MDS0524153.1 rhomboid family intramembrane serine protease [Clostridium sp. SHJSY1]
MDQCKNIYSKKEIWIGLKNFSEGILAVIITDNSNADVDEKEAREYLLGKGLDFRLSVIVLSDGNSFYDYNKNYSKVVVDINNPRIIYCDLGLEVFGNISAEIIRRNKNSGIRNVSKYTVTVSLIAINIVVFIISALMTTNFVKNLSIDDYTLAILGAKYTPLINQGQWWRLFTCMFLHGGLIHIAVNMYSLYSIGTQIEEIYGRYKYLIIYIISGLTASLFSYYLSPNSLSVGASGAIFGLLGAILAFAIKERERMDKGVIGNIIITIAFNLYLGTAVLSNIDNYAHVGGFIGGLIVAGICLIKK